MRTLIVVSVLVLGSAELAADKSDSKAVRSASELVSALGFATDKGHHHVTQENWLVLITMIVVGTAVVFWRWKIAASSTRFVCEIVVLLTAMTFGYGFYLLKRVDSEFELLFMHCVALDLLLGFDNIVDIVGWYGTAHLSYGRSATLILGGAFVQTVVRVPLLPYLIRWTESSEMWSQSTAILLVLLASRNIYLAFTAGETAVAGNSYTRCLTRMGISLPVRVLLCEATVLVCDLDAFIAKTLITKDGLAVAASSAAVIPMLRAVALLLLLYIEEEILPMYLLWGLSGGLMLSMAAHQFYPQIPEIPAFLRMGIPTFLYAYAVGICVYLMAKNPGKGGDLLDEGLAGKDSAGQSNARRPSLRTGQWVRARRNGGNPNPDSSI